MSIEERVRVFNTAFALAWSQIPIEKLRDYPRASGDLAQFLQARIQAGDRNAEQLAKEAVQLFSEK